jgi:hypothetical protein
MKNTFYLNTVLIIVMGVAVASCAGDDKAKLAELKKKAEKNS